MGRVNGTLQRLIGDSASASTTASSSSEDVGNNVVSPQSLRGKQSFRYPTPQLDVQADIQRCDDSTQCYDASFEVCTAFGSNDSDTLMPSATPRTEKTKGGNDELDRIVRSLTQRTQTTPRGVEGSHSNHVEWAGRSNLPMKQYEMQTSSSSSEATNLYTSDDESSIDEHRTRRRYKARKSGGNKIGREHPMLGSMGITCLDESEPHWRPWVERMEEEISRHEATCRRLGLNVCNNNVTSTLSCQDEVPGVESPQSLEESEGKGYYEACVRIPFQLPDVAQYSYTRTQEIGAMLSHEGAVATEALVSAFEELVGSGKPAEEADSYDGATQGSSEWKGMQWHTKVFDDFVGKARDLLAEVAFRTTVPSNCAQSHSTETVGEPTIPPVTKSERAERGDPWAEEATSRSEKGSLQRASKDGVLLQLYPNDGPYKHDLAPISTLGDDPVRGENSGRPLNDRPVANPSVNVSPKSSFQVSEQLQRGYSSSDDRARIKREPTRGELSLQSKTRSAHSESWKMLDNQLMEEFNMSTPEERSTSPGQSLEEHSELDSTLARNDSRPILELHAGVLPQFSLSVDSGDFIFPESIHSTASFPTTKDQICCDTDNSSRSEDCDIPAPGPATVKGMEEYEGGTVQVPHISTETLVEQESNGKSKEVQEGSGQVARSMARVNSTAPKVLQEQRSNGNTTGKQDNGFVAAYAAPKVLLEHSSDENTRRVKTDNGETDHTAPKVLLEQTSNGNIKGMQDHPAPKLLLKLTSNGNTEGVQGNNEPAVKTAPKVLVDQTSNGNTNGGQDDNGSVTNGTPKVLWEQTAHGKTDEDKDHNGPVAGTTPKALSFDQTSKGHTEEEPVDRVHAANSAPGLLREPHYYYGNTLLVSEDHSADPTMRPGRDSDGSAWTGLPEPQEDLGLPYDESIAEDSTIELRLDRFMTMSD